MGKINRMKNYMLALLGLLLIGSSCSTEEEEKDSILPDFAFEEIDRRVSEFKKRKKMECLERVNEEAIARVDSTLLQMEILIPIDTTAKLIKPRRPSLPPLREKSDTTPIKPFDTSVKKDS